MTFFSADLLKSPLEPEATGTVRNVILERSESKTERWIDVTKTIYIEGASVLIPTGCKTVVVARLICHGDHRLVRVTRADGSCYLVVERREVLP